MSQNTCKILEQLYKTNDKQKFKQLCNYLYSAQDVEFFLAQLMYTSSC